MHIHIWVYLCVFKMTIYQMCISLFSKEWMVKDNWIIWIMLQIHYGFRSVVIALSLDAWTCLCI